MTGPDHISRHITGCLWWLTAYLLTITTTEYLLMTGYIVPWPTDQLDRQLMVVLAVPVAASGVFAFFLTGRLVCAIAPKGRK